jgi:hypothetical protein
MSFIIKTINNVSKYVIVEHEGELTREEFEAARAIAKIKLDKNNWRKLLVDVRSTVKSMPTVDVYYVMENNIKVLPYVKIALVFPPERKAEGDFAETVAANRGVRLRSFIDYEQAVAWLTGGST